MSGLVMAEMTALAFEVGFSVASAARLEAEAARRHAETVAIAGELLDAMVRDHTGEVTL